MQLKFKYQKFRRGILLLCVALFLALVGSWYLEGTVPRHVVLATGTESGVNHLYAQRYVHILARDGIALEEKLTAGGVENLRLLRNSDSAVDLAIIPGGIYRPEEGIQIMMLATLYYEPLWIFYRNDHTLSHLSELRDRRIAIGSPDSSVRAFVDPLLVANNISEVNTGFVPKNQHDAVMALRNGEVDAIFLLGPVNAPAIWEALNEPTFKLMSLENTKAYQRRFPYITKLTLPAGAVDFAKRIPAQEVELIGTKAMLVAREGLSFALIQVLLDAARQIHSMQGFFEEPAEFPNTMPVDVPASLDATRHMRFGPKMLQRYMPLVAASYVERVFVILVPLVIILIPLLEFTWRMFKALVMQRIHRLYGELMLLEREVNAATGDVAVARWIADLDRIEKNAGSMSVPKIFAHEAYILREHVKFVRREVLARAESSDPLCHQ